MPKIMILTSIIYRWTFHPMTYSSFNVLAVAMHFMMTATLFSISSTLIIHNWPVMVSKEVVVNIQSYSKAQVVFKISVQNFNQNQIIIDTRKKYTWSSFIKKSHWIGWNIIKYLYISRLKTSSKKVSLMKPTNYLYH